MTSIRLDMWYYAWRIKKFWLATDTAPAAICSIISGYLWAACLAFDGDTLQRATYKYMAQIAPEWVWMGWFFAVATIQTWRLFSRPHRRMWHLDLTIKFVAMMTWVTVAVACMISQYPPAAAVSDTIVIAIACLWDFLRCDPRCDRKRCGHCSNCPYEARGGRHE
jgi:hypothetical protein